MKRSLEADDHADDEQHHGLYDDAGVTTAPGAAIMTTATPIPEGEMPPRGNAHDVSERGRDIMRRLRARAAAKGLPAPDLTDDLDLRRRIYRAARRIEDARARRGDVKPFLLDEEPRGRWRHLRPSDLSAEQRQSWRGAQVPAEFAAPKSLMDDDAA